MRIRQVRDMKGRQYVQIRSRRFGPKTFNGGVRYVAATVPKFSIQNSVKQPVGHARKDGQYSPP